MSRSLSALVMLCLASMYIASSSPAKAAFYFSASPCPAGKVCTPNPNPTPCRTATGAPCKNLPDLTARPAVRIGNPAHAPIPAGTWGGSISLTDQDAIVRNNGRCEFNIWYEIENIGTALASPAFVDTIKVGAAPVSVSPAIAPVPAGATRAMHTTAWLPGGAHMLSLDIDSGNVVVESNKANNQVQLKYTLVGNCRD